MKREAGMKMKQDLIGKYLVAVQNGVFFFF
jgi:hypothetical protein